MPQFTIELFVDALILALHCKDVLSRSLVAQLLEAYDKEWALKDEGKREGFDDGYDSGYDSGLDEGINLGIEQGIEQNKIEMIKNMLNENISIDLISKVSGLTINDIKKIKNKI